MKCFAPILTDMTRRTRLIEEGPVITVLWNSWELITTLTINKRLNLLTLNVTI